MLMAKKVNIYLYLYFKFLIFMRVSENTGRQVCPFQDEVKKGQEEDAAAKALNHVRRDGCESQ